MLSKLLRIQGNNFRSLAGLTFNNRRSVILVKCGDIHPFDSPPIFTEAETIFIENCDKNFVYYWLKPQIFPKVKNIYLSSHPCEPSVFYRFLDQSETPIIHLHERYIGYKIRWASNLDCMVSIKDSEIEEILKTYNQVDDYGN